MSLTSCVKYLWLSCLEKGITISAEHIPDRSNTTADYQSRLVQTSAEWKLDLEIFTEKSQRLGPFQIDHLQQLNLFATAKHSAERVVILCKVIRFTNVTLARLI